MSGLDRTLWKGTFPCLRSMPRWLAVQLADVGQRVASAAVSAGRSCLLRQKARLAARIEA
jgi:hypothetical protein